MVREIWKIGGWSIRDPHLMVRLTVFIEEYQLVELPMLWAEKEIEALDRIPTLKTEDYFYEENIVSKGMVHCSRYYTPLTNRFKLASQREMMT